MVVFPGVSLGGAAYSEVAPGRATAREAAAKMAKMVFWKSIMNDCGYVNVGLDKAMGDLERL